MFRLNHVLAILLVRLVDASEPDALHMSECITDQSRCFIFYPNHALLNYSAADTKCRSNGGTLAVINNQDILQLLANTIRGKFGVWSPWIGLHFDQNGTWVNADGTSLNHSVFNPWAEQQPQPAQDCARLYTFESKLYSGNCSHSFSYICQYDASINSSPNPTTQYVDEYSYEFDQYADEVSDEESNEADFLNIVRLEEKSDSNVSDSRMLSNASYANISLNGSVFHMSNSRSHVNTSGSDSSTNMLPDTSELDVSDLDSGPFMVFHPNTSPESHTRMTECERQRISCSIPSLSHKGISVIEMHSTVKIGQELTLMCDEGYFLQETHPKSHLRIRCNGFDEWNPPAVNLKCYKFDQFAHTHRAIEEKIIRSSPGQSLVLPCKIRSDQLNSTHEVKWLWTRNQIAIDNISSLGNLYKIDNSGIISFEFVEELRGTYLCYADVGNILEVALVAYIVTDHKCNKSASNGAIPNINVQEANSVRLICFNYVPDTAIAAPVWYRNKSRIWSNDRFTVLPDGGLFIKNVCRSDEGTYYCIYTERETCCNVTTATNVRVMSTSKPICGKSKNKLSLPWLVSLWWLNDTSPFCYGTLVHNEWVVTLGSCVYGSHTRTNPGIRVKLYHTSNTEIDEGTNISTEIDHWETSISTDIAILHPNYSRIHNNGEVGLLKLNKSSYLPSDLMPICLLESFDEYFRQKKTCQTVITGEVSGYGSFKKHYGTFGKVSLTAHNLEIDTACPITSHADDLFFVTSKMSQSSFPADVGSPFHVKWGDYSYLYGIFNWGEEETNGAYSSYFTKVSKYVDWIKSTIKANA